MREGEGGKRGKSKRRGRSEEEGMRMVRWPLTLRNGRRLGWCWDCRSVSIFLANSSSVMLPV